MVDLNNNLLLNSVFATPSGLMMDPDSYITYVSVNPDLEFPVMEMYPETLKTLLDTLFCKMDLTSWTVHENVNGTVCTLRFGDSSTSDCDAKKGNKTTTYKKVY